MDKDATRQALALVFVVAMVMVPSVAFAGGAQEGAGEAAVTPSGTDHMGQEAPMLAELVAAGELPPLEERLPKDPMVIQPHEQVGEYGGEIEYYRIKNRPGNSVTVWGSHDSIVVFDQEAAEIIPSVAKDYEVSSDGTTFTFYLREGMKWSDGEPFTSDDIAFWWNDIVNNETLSPAFPSRWKTDEGRATFTKLDSYTVQFTFPAARGLLLEELAGVIPGHIYAPEHYLKQFHADYGSETDIQNELDARNLENWDELFGQENDYYTYANPNLPVLKAWVLQTAPPATRYVLERNPYYYKVDTAGNQLPYIDRFIQYPGVDAEVINLNVITGKADIGFRGLTVTDYTLYKENEEKGDYRVIQYDNDQSSDIALMPNLTCNDEVFRELVNDLRFRKALSMSINRDQINELVYLGLGTPRANTLFEESPFYRQGSGWSTMYIDYDIDASNELLDEMGLEWDADMEYRLRPDGQRLSILCEGPSGMKTKLDDIFSILKQNWKQLGIDVDWRITDRNNYRNRVRAGEVQLGTWTGGEGYYPIRFSQSVPTRDLVYWASKYGAWYASDGQSGEKPSGDILKLQELYTQILKTVDPEKQKELIQEIYDINAENVYTIGLVGKTPTVLTVRSNMRNVPEEGISSWMVGHYVGHKQVSTWYYE